MIAAKEGRRSALAEEVIQTFDEVNGGVHAGFRPAHAKGILLLGVFTPSPGAASLTRAPHLQRTSTPVWVRFSDFAGIPSVADNDPNASPRGMAIRFYLAEHVHTDIIAHSVDGFPTRTAEEFVEFLRAVHASGPGVAKPPPIDRFLQAHPSAMEFVQLAGRPMPSSFVRECYFAVNAYKFVSKDDVIQYGRYRIKPEAGVERLDSTAAAATPPNYLFDELRQRLTTSRPRMHIAVQIAQPGDVVDDSTVHWPQERAEIDFGTVELSGIVPDNDAEQRHIIFDPIPRVDGIEPSNDPLLQPRADVYLMSGRRRRSANPVEIR